jgi:hypothetical protein
MYFEEEYTKIIKEKLFLFLELYGWSFHSKEDMLEKFNKHEDLSVTIKTFNKWMEACKFTVLDCVVVKDEGTPPAPSTPRTSYIPSEEDTEVFDNEKYEDWYPPNLVKDHTKPQEPPRKED